MFLEAIILLFALHQCSNNKKNNITVFTNYNKNIEADFLALAMIIWNDVLLKILHFIVLENNQEEISRNESTNKFLTEMLLSKKPKAFDKIYKFNIKFHSKLIELRNKILKHTEFEYIKDKETKSWLKSLNNSYYNFINLHKGTLIKNESLQTFYALCFFYRIKINEIGKSIDIKLSVDFYSTDELDTFNSKCVDFRIVLSTKTSGYIFGAFILPVFNGGCLQMDSTKTSFDILKNLENHVYRHIIVRSRGKSDFNLLFNIILQNYKPINLHQYFDISTFNIIYEKLNNCSWLYVGFQSYQSLGKYFEVYEVCNPNYFKLPVILNNDNLLTNLKLSTPIEANTIHSKNTIYISSNYLTHTKHIEYGAYKNNLLVPLLEYTTLRLALEKFKFWYNFDVIKQYFDIENMERNFEEIIKLRGTNDKPKEAIVDIEEK